MRSRSSILYRVAAVLLIPSLALTLVGCVSLVERLVPQRDPAPTIEPSFPPPGTTPVAARPASRPVPRAERPTGVISMQAGETVASEVIDISGGEITVVRPGDPIDGLVLEIPAGAYPDAREFSISSSPIIAHTFGDGFNPLSPLITVENGGDYSDEFMTVTVPIDLPDGWFAMPFYYDEATGTLEGIPFTDLRQDSITVVTRHFSSFTISGILNSHLDGLIAEGIDSGFRPGVDDWQFTNYGSYIAPHGHCAGQAISAMWYYCEQPDGEDPFLWGLYDNNGREPATPDLWEDDSYGYRFASTTQGDINWGNFEVQFQRSFRGTNDVVQFKGFAYAMYLTGEPQYVGITSSQGGGHAMVVYRVDGGALYIADPNYPGDLTRRIVYRDGAFVPYQSGANAAEIAAGNSTSYESIGLMLKTAMVDWQRLSARWQEFRAGTIGDDRFPPYQVLVIHDDDTEELLLDGYESEHDRIRFSVTSPGVPIGVYVYRDGVLVQPGNDGKYSLREGYNLIGLEVWGDVNKNPNNRRWRYIDFQYFNVWYGPDQEVPAGYPGWVLESMEWELQPNFYDEDPYRTGFQWSAQEGSYVASGRFWVGTESGQSAQNIWVEFTDTGSWTPPPSFVPSGELGSIVIATTSDLAVVEGTPEEYGWGTTWDNRIMVLIDPGESAGVVQTRATTAGGETASKTVEFDLYPYGTPVEGLIIDLIVMPVTTAGSGKYVYTYVYRVE